MVITDFLERNSRLYGSEVSLVEINPSEERDAAVTWRDSSLIESARPDAPYRREMTWRDFDRKANRFANLLLSRGLQRGAKVGILLMNCLEWLPLYFGILKAGCPDGPDCPGPQGREDVLLRRPERAGLRRGLLPPGDLLLLQRAAGGSG